MFWKMTAKYLHIWPPNSLDFACTFVNIEFVDKIKNPLLIEILVWANIMADLHIAFGTMHFCAELSGPASEQQIILADIIQNVINY